MKPNSEIIHDITDPFCKYDICKRLKEIGFDVPTQNYWEESLTEEYDEQDGYSGAFGWRKGEINFRNGFVFNSHVPTNSNDSWYICSAPTIQTVVEWFRLNYNIWIGVDYIQSIGKYKPYIKSITSEDINLTDLEHHDNPYSASADAIRYVLNTLI